MIRFARKLALPLCFVLLTGVACGGGDDNNASGAGGDGGNEEIKIGAIFDLSGATADVGTPYAEGIRDYIEYRNSQGGVEGRRLALTWQDYGYRVPQAEQLYQQYVAEGAKVFMGWGTGDTEALRPRVNADRIPFMSASYAETLTDPKVTPYNFFPGASYSQQMRIALQWISDQNKDKHVEVAVFHHDSPFGTSPLEDGKKYIADHKLDIGFRSYAMPAGATDFVAQIGQAKSQGANYVVIQNVASPAAKLISNLQDQKAGAQVICLNWCADELTARLAGASAEKMVGIMPFAPPKGDEPGLAEINSYLQGKGTDAKAKGLHYVQGWFTMASMVQGIENALKKNPDEIDGPAIKEGLEEIDNFTTPVSSPISFSDAYHAGMDAVPVYQFTGGAWTKIHDPIKVEVEVGK
ncbi:MAG TPA: ABC transporter substrate-binding protein [Actinomycetota bacterium]|nr:ABC transporter substrate-binding protein [Actinomycetota bacterium]